MMMRKRYMLCLPLVAAMVALMAASAFAVAPIIDELPRVVIAAPGNSFPNAVNLDAYINWFPITTAEPAGANRGYVGHATMAAGYTPSGKRFHVYLYDGTRGRTLSNKITLADDTNLLHAAPPVSTLPAVGTDRYNIDPYPLVPGPKMLNLVYSSAATTSSLVDVFAVVEGHIDGTQLASGYQTMTVVTGGTANAASYGVDFIANRNSDSFAFWIPKPIVVTGVISGLPPSGNDLTNLSWVGKAMRDQARLASWTVTGFEPSVGYAVGDFTAAARSSNGNVYVFFIPNDGGGMPSPVFQAKARFVSTAPNAAACPGYRFGFTNAAATHYGDVQVIGDPLSLPFGAAGTVASLRGIGHDFIARILWAPPSTVTGMSASGVIKTFANEVVLEPHTPDPILIDRDGRDYTIETLCIAGLTSTNDFIIDSLSVTTLSDASLQVASTTRWTTASLVSNWGISFYGFALTGITNGEGKFEGNAALLWGARDARVNVNANASTAGTLRAVKMVPSANHGAPAASAPALYRTSLTIQSEGIHTDLNTQFSPNLMLHHSILPANLSSGTHANQISWYEFWGPSTYVKDPRIATLPTGGVSPGVPLGTGGPSVLKSYMWSHTVPSDTTYAVFPEITVYNTGVYNSTPALPCVWGDADGFYKITDVKVQQISNYH